MFDWGFGFCRGAEPFSPYLCHLHPSPKQGNILGVSGTGQADWQTWASFTLAFASPCHTPSFMCLWMCVCSYIYLKDFHLLAPSSNIYSSQGKARPNQKLQTQFRSPLGCASAGSWTLKGSHDLTPGDIGILNSISPTVPNTLPWECHIFCCCSKCCSRLSMIISSVFITYYVQGIFSL